MEREEIIKRAKDLPVIQMGHVAEDHEIFEGNEGMAHFKITKEVMRIATYKLTVYALSVSGESFSKELVIKEFSNVLGEPLIRDAPADFPGIDFALWNAVEADRRLE